MYCIEVDYSMSRISCILNLMPISHCNIHVQNNTERQLERHCHTVGFWSSPNFDETAVFDLLHSPNHPHLLPSSSYSSFY